MKTGFGKAKLAQKKARVVASVKAAARSELLAGDGDAGFIQPEDGELTHLLSQAQLRAVVDVQSATKVLSSLS